MLCNLCTKQTRSAENRQFGGPFRPRQERLGISEWLTRKFAESVK